MSPIESALRNAIIAAAADFEVGVSAFTEGGEFQFTSDTAPHPHAPCVDGEMGIEAEAGGDNSYWSLFRNVKALTYRVDHLLVGHYPYGSTVLAVECDGHEFHDRTKQQASYDRARDRELFARGLPTVRFTGSEIHHDAHRCAHEIWAIAISLWLQRDHANDLLVTHGGESYADGYAAGYEAARAARKDKG